MKPKIAIATMIGQNQGNRLQNYALQRVLQDKSGGHVETLRVGYGPTRSKQLVKRALYRAFPARRWARFEEFDNDNIRYANCSIDDPDLADKGYSLFVIGSDQVWNPSFPFTSEAEYLPQIPSELKASYAASFGIPKITEHSKKIGCFLKAIGHISVREQAGVRIIKELAGREASLVVDPTMLIEADAWLSFAKKPRIEIPKDGYVLKYVLGKDIPNDAIADMGIGPNGSVIDLKDKSLPVGPAEFVWLISNARFVCTDSFHASVFSVLFHVPFAIFERVSNNEDMSSRFDTLCETFGLSGRRTSKRKGEPLIPIDWESIERKLVFEREKSARFLEVCLHDAGLA